VTDRKRKNATSPEVPLGTMGVVSQVYICLSHATSFVGSAVSYFRSAEVDVDRYKQLGEAYSAVSNARMLLQSIEKDLMKFRDRLDTEEMLKEPIGGDK
jgi:hypothetical protein